MAAKIPRSCATGSRSGSASTPGSSSSGQSLRRSRPRPIPAAAVEADRLRPDPPPRAPRSVAPRPASRHRLDPTMQLRGGMNELVRQAARMQRKIDDVKKGIKDKEVSGSSAGDKVSVTVTCEGKLRKIDIDP